MYSPQTGFAPDRDSSNRHERHPVLPQSAPPCKQNDRALHLAAVLQRVSLADQHALGELYDATSSAVFGLALRILNEQAAAEEVVVDVYQQVWTTAKRYDPQRGTVLAWLLTMTRSRAIDLLRARNRSGGTEPLEAAANIPSSIPEPEEVSLAAERHRFVRAALESLNADQRQAIELAYFSGLSHSAIAIRLKQPLGTVKTRIRVGMIKLRVALSERADLGSHNHWNGQ